MNFNEYKSIIDNDKININDSKTIALNVNYEQLRSIVMSLYGRKEGLLKFDLQLGKDELHPMSEDQLEQIHKINKYELDGVYNVINYVNSNMDEWMESLINKSMKYIKLIEVIYDAHKVEPCDKVKSEIQEIIENHINEFNKYYEVNKLDDWVETDHDLLKLFVFKILYPTYKHCSELVYNPLEVTLISEIIMYGRIIKIKIGIK